MNIDDIEQHAPKQPNFGLVVALFCATLLIFFVLAYLFVDLEGSHLTFRHHPRHLTSQLTIPTLPNNHQALSTYPLSLIPIT